MGKNKKQLTKSEVKSLAETSALHNKLKKKGLALCRKCRKTVRVKRTGSGVVADNQSGLNVGRICFDCMREVRNGNS